MKKKIFIVGVILLIACITSITVFAYYTFTKNIEINISHGKITESKVTLYRKGDNADILIDSNTTGFKDGTLYCYASEKKVYNEDDFVEVKDLKAIADVKTSIESVVRVKISEEWEDYKIYFYGTEKNEIISKPTTPYLVNYLLGTEDIKGASINNPNLQWNYDPISGYAYYYGTITSDTSITLFDYSNYQYSLQAAGSYHETMYVSLAFELQICQLNRAETVWNVSSSMWEKEE